MRIQAVVSSSLIDYPGKICAVVFTQGCNFRCPYCHNPELVNPELFVEPQAEDIFFDFLKRRVGKLDAVAVSGGEPTLHADLPDFFLRVKKMGFLTKLDTNGTNYPMLRYLIENDLVDYIAMDIKAPLAKYAEVTRVKIDTDVLRRSVLLIRSSGKKFEFRTTVVPDLLDSQDLINLMDNFMPLGNWSLQNFVPTKTLDSSYREKKPMPTSEMEFLKLNLTDKVDKLILR